MSFAKKALAIGTLATLGVAASASAQSTLNGAGATFPAPLYQRWFQELAAKGQAHINYQSVGSGAGVRQFHRLAVRRIEVGGAPARSDACQLLRSLREHILLYHAARHGRFVDFGQYPAAGLPRQGVPQR